MAQTQKMKMESKLDKLPLEQRQRVRQLLKKYHETKSAYYAYFLSNVLGYEPDTKEIYGGYTPKPSYEHIKYTQSLPVSEFF